MHYLTGHETTARRIHHRLGFVWSRTTPGWASPSIVGIWLIVKIPVVQEGRGL